MTLAEGGSSIVPGLDHRGEDLAGRSFVDGHLDGADFRGSDLRGADLTRASLVGADFTDAKLGIRPLAAIAFFALTLLVVAATGWLIGWTLSGLVEGVMTEGSEEVFGSALAIIVAALFILAVVAYGLSRALRYGVVLVVIALLVNYLVVAGTSRELDLARDGRVVGIFVLLTASMIAGGIARVVGGTFSPWAIVVVGLTGGYAAGQAGGGIAGIVVSLLLVVLAKRTLLADRRDRFARRIVHRLVGRRGTRFTDADLTDADFSRTSLAQADLTGATLVGARLDTIKGWPPFVDRPPGSA